MHNKITGKLATRMRNITSRFQYYYIRNPFSRKNTYLYLHFLNVVHEFCIKIQFNTNDIMKATAHATSI